MPMRTLILAAGLSLALSACTTTGGSGRYTGDTQYYWENGVLWSCREPNAVMGGNCMVDSEWPDGGLAKR